MVGQSLAGYNVYKKESNDSQSRYKLNGNCRWLVRQWIVERLTTNGVGNDASGIFSSELSIHPSYFSDTSCRLGGGAGGGGGGIGVLRPFSTI